MFDLKSDLRIISKYDFSPFVVIGPEPIVPENGKVEMEVKLELKMEVEMEVKMDAPILPSA